MKNIGDERNDLNKDKCVDEQLVHHNSNEANSKNPDENYIIEDDEAEAFFAMLGTSLASRRMAKVISPAGSLSS